MLIKTKVGVVLRILALVAVVYVNYLANALPINGYTTGELSDMYPNAFVPAGITFAIWGVIYLLLAIYVLAPLKDWKSVSGNAYGWLMKSSVFFLINCMANASWIYGWHHRMVGLSVLIMLVLLGTLIAIYIIQRKNHINSWYFRIPIEVYLGWISVATIANFTTLLVDHGWSGGPLSEDTWAIIMVITAFVLGVFFLFKDHSFFYSLVICWATYGIWIKHQVQYEILGTVAISSSVLLLALVLIQIIRSINNPKVGYVK